MFKVVMYGHPKTDPNDLKSYFVKELNIETNAVYEIKTKSGDPNNAIFLFHFNKSAITMSDLSKVKVVNHTVVRWAPYSPKLKGPTQCRSCTMYGHGAENCHRKPICLYCASTTHEANKCALNPLNPAAAKSGTVFRCHSCHSKQLPSNHMANDPMCPERNNYLAIRNNLNSRNARKQNSNRNESQFVHPTNNSRIKRNVPPNLTRPTLSYADSVKQSNLNEDSGDLFSMTDLLSIFKNAVNDLKKCRSKLDQIQVIASLLEYAVN